MPYFSHYSKNHSDKMTGVVLPVNSVLAVIMDNADALKYLCC